MTYVRLCISRVEYWECFGKAGNMSMIITVGVVIGTHKYVNKHK